MHAIFVKKIIHSWRSRIITAAQLLLPALCTLFVASQETVDPERKDTPSLTFDLQKFGRTLIPYADGTSSNSGNISFTILYEKQLLCCHTMEYFNISNQETFDNYTIKQLADMGIADFNKKVIIGMEVIAATPPETMAAIAYFNGQPYHSEPISVNYLVNAFLQFILNDSFSLQSAIYPLPEPETKDKITDLFRSSFIGFNYGFFIVIGMSFLTTLFVFFLIKERKVGSKHVQLITGISPITYWLPTFLWDFINYVVPAVLVMLVLVAYNCKPYLEDSRWALVILVLVAYGWAVLPYMYVVQFLFKSAAAGVVMVLMLSICSGEGHLK